MLSLALGFALIGAQVNDQLPDENQARERSGPFSYFLVPSDVLGFKDSPEGFQVTYDGAIRGADFETRFYAGNSANTLVGARVKTLVNEHIPIMRWQREIDGLEYSIEAFAAPAELNPLNNLVAFIRIQALNPDEGGKEAQLRMAMDSGAGRKGRAALAAQGWYRNLFGAKAVSMETAPTFNIDTNLWSQDGHVIAATEDFKILDGIKRPTYRGKPATWIIKIPFIPIDAAKTDQVEALKAMDFYEYRQQVLNYWNDMHRTATRIEVADKKVTDTLRSSLTYMMIARDKMADGSYVQKVNEFQYDAFFPRDNAYFCRTYGMVGLPDIQRETLDHFLVKDAGGNVTGFLRAHTDDWGQSVWAAGAYWRNTRDDAFAKSLVPAMRKHLAEFREKTAADPMGLWPVAPPYDNEALNGHYTGHNLWALLGMEMMIDLARAGGDAALAEEIAAVRADFDQVVKARIGELAGQAEGYMPPGMDSPELGYDWANASAGIYPFEVYSPGDAMAESTMRMIREYKYREGIMTYGPNAWQVKRSTRLGQDVEPGYLHHYETFYLDQALLASGYQQEVVEDLYSVLAHTSSTNAGFEFSIMPWADRDPGGNLTPHGWFAARYIELVRNMLVREHEGSLHLCSALAPRWVRPDEHVKIERSLTYFGRADFDMEVVGDGANWTFDFDLHTQPKTIQLHLPWFVTAKSAKLDGRDVSFAGGVIQIPPTAKRLEVKWDRNRDIPDLSYEKAVDLWLKKNYSDAKVTEPGFLFPRPTRPVIDGSRLFIGRMDVAIRTGEGKVYYTTDGSVPTTRSQEYRRPFRIESNTTITAINVWPDGRVSEPSVATFTSVTARRGINILTSQPGLKYDYYEVDDATGLADVDFATLHSNYNGVAAEPDLSGVPHREDNFFVRYKGYIAVPETGVYTFRLGSDDGSRLLVGGELLIDHDGLHPYTLKTGAVALEAGFHFFEVHFFEKGDAQRLTVEVATDGRTFKPINPTWLNRDP